MQVFVIVHVRQVRSPDDGDSAVAVVIGAVLLVAILVSLLTSFLLWYIPSTGTANDISALNQQESSLVHLSEEMSSANMHIGSTVTGSVPLGIKGSPPFSQGVSSSITYDNSTNYFSGYMNYSYNVSFKPTSNINSTYVITIANKQNLATTQPFDESFALSAAQIDYSNNSNYSNIAFFYLNGTSVPSWLQNKSSNGAMWWLQMDSIKADSYVKINLFVYNKYVNAMNGISVGEAPTLSSGPYDNGQVVFPVYLDTSDASHINSVSGIGVTDQKLKGPYGNLISAIYVSGLGKYSYSGITFNDSLLNQPVIGESSFLQNYNPSDMGVMGISNSNSTNTMSNLESVDMGYGSSYFSGHYMVNSVNTIDHFQQGNANSNWNYAEISFYGASSNEYSGFISPSPSLSSGGYSATFDLNPLSSSHLLYLTFSGDTISGYPWNLYIGWAFLTFMPPNNIMPVIQSIIKSSSGFTQDFSQSVFFHGIINDTLPLSYMPSTNLYLAGSTVVEKQVNYSEFISPPPLNFVISRSGNISFTAFTSTINGSSVSTGGVGSSIIQLISSNYVSNSYYVGENLTLLSQTLLPYSILVTGINLTGFSYTILGNLAGAIQNLYSANNSLEHYMMVYNMNNKVEISLKTILNLYLIDISESIFQIINI